MNGADTLVQTSIQAGVEVCFANPGTTEMHLVAALDHNPGMRAVLGLFEGVCTGAADGYGRMTGKPAATLLHLGPGFANGIANLHNARRARTPIVNWIGDQASWHLAADAPLTSDIASLARAVGWVRENQTAANLAQDGAETIAAASSTPGQVATLVVPADSAWDDASGPARPVAPTPASPVADAGVTAAADALTQAGALLFIGGSTLGERGLRAAHRIAAGTGCSLIAETFSARTEIGQGLPAVSPLPYFPEQGREALASATNVVLADALDPVAFFGYPGQESRLLGEAQTLSTLARPGDDAIAALEAVAERVGKDAPLQERGRAEVGDGPLSVGSLGQTLAALVPEQAIVVNEAATTGLAFNAFAPAAAPHTSLGLTGGAIGQGLPCAVGAAIACPDRPVIAFQADGSGLYTLQALWTMARESLDVVVVICANRVYRILQAELARAGVMEPGPKAASLTDLGNPNVDWVAAAKGFGVPGVSVDDTAEFATAFTRALAERGPSLIEAVLHG
jgi:acetolactate synthase-1/2/3 large subunit